MRDPFEGCDDGNIRCEWLGDEAAGAHVVRLIVDHARWEAHWPNATYQLSAIAKIRRHVAATLPSAKLIICPAGMITVGVDESVGALRSLPTIACELEARMLGIRWGTGPAVIFGIDGAVSGRATPIQGTMVIDAGASVPDRASLMLKLYPASHEASSLVAWRLFCRHRIRPANLGNRRVRVGSMSASPVICHEAVAFSGRSTNRRASGSQRDHIARYLGAAVGGQYIALAGHWADVKRGGIFIDAARKLAESSAAVVATSLFAPGKDLEVVARRFEVARPSGLRGGHRVATLLVRDSV